MSKPIDYYFTSISPFTYLGHNAFVELCKNHEQPINFKPVKIADVFAVSGATPPAQRPKCRQEYRLVELRRWAKKRGLPINLQPVFFPTPPALADRTVIALQLSGNDPAAFLGKALAAVWVEDRDISSAETITDILDSLNLDSAVILQTAQSDEAEQVYATNTQEAIEQGVLGAPAYLYQDEQYWGQDRIELLAEIMQED